jgi:ComF family protein
MSAVKTGKVDEWWYRSLPGRCCFCLAPSEVLAPWCEACAEALPWNLPACPGCAEPQPRYRGSHYCARCIDAPAAFEVARVPLRYEAAVATLVQHFKFDASPRAGNLLVELMMIGLLRDDVALPDVLVAVPLHPKRARQRGFDQGRWLGQRLSARLGVPLRMAMRHRDTPTQRELNRSQRRGNLAEAFAVAERLPQRVALIDDVMTTGATLDALARACRAAGAEHVEAWALARTPLFDAQHLPAR